MLRKSFRRNDLGLASFYICFIHDATHSTVMVHMGVAVDDCRHWALSKLFIGKCECGACRLGTDERVKNNPAFVALDQSQIRDIGRCGP